MTEVPKITSASLSTMWAIKNFSSLNAFFGMINQLGFQKIELNHQVDSAMLSDVNLDHCQFSSIHEPCPANISTKELVARDWLISSADEASRRQGVEAVKKSIKLAHTLSAPSVVVHCGNVTSLMDDEYKLRALFDKDDSLSDAYQSMKSQIMHLRAELVPPRIQAVKKSLFDLLEYASQFNIKLGLENRYHYMDIPSINEMGELLDLADASYLGFIYDVGHAQAMHRLGFYDHEDWLMRYSSRMFGCHLHDVIGLSDHLAPGLGEIDFSRLVPYLPKNSFRTLEVLPSNSISQIKAGLDLLVNAGCVNYI